LIVCKAAHVEAAGECSQTASRRPILFEQSRPRAKIDGRLRASVA
jgi:hypothetical protein